MNVDESEFQRCALSRAIGRPGIESNIRSGLTSYSYPDRSRSNICRDGLTRPRNQSLQPSALCLVMVVSMLISVFRPVEAQTFDPHVCLSRDGQIPHISAEHRSNYECKLFITKDEIARYVFLTNAKGDGDRSVAIYRAPGRQGSLPGHYWVTVTEASDSLDGNMDIRAVTVRRYDRPLPASTAKAVHELWLAMLERTRVEENTFCTSPTGIFAVRTASGTRLEAVTIERTGNCNAISKVADMLIIYPRHPPPRRFELAKKIEKESYRLLKRVTQGS